MSVPACRDALRAATVFLFRKNKNYTQQFTAILDTEYYFTIFLLAVIIFVVHIFMVVVVICVILVKIEIAIPTFKPAL